MSLTWLHISDIHFGSRSEAFWREPALDALLRKVEDEAKRGWQPNLIFCTGDIAFSGNPAEYEDAKQFFERLLSATQLKKERLFIVPGNHDVDQTKLGLSRRVRVTKADESDRFFGQRDILESFLQKFHGFQAFLRDYLGRQFDCDKYCFHDVVELEDLQGLRVGVAGFNTAWLSGKGDREGRMLLGRLPLVKAFHKLEESPRLDLKVAMFHHPLEWLREFERDDVQHDLVAMADVVLMGHLDYPNLANLLQGGEDRRVAFLRIGPTFRGSHFPNRVYFARYYVQECRRKLALNPLRYLPKEIDWDTDTEVLATLKRLYGSDQMDLGIADVMPRLEVIQMVMARYSEEVELWLRSRRPRPWRQHYIVPLGLERLEWKADSLTVETMGYFSSLADALRQHPHWVLLGKPGGGKTAMLEQFAVELRGDICPVLIEPTHTVSDPVSLINQVLGSHALEAPKDSILAGLENRRFYFLIDGLEERDSAGRQQVRQLCIEHPELPAVVASRETFYLDLPATERLPSHFRLLRVKPVPPREIEPYLVDRLGAEEGTRCAEIIRKNSLEPVFQTPLFLDIFCRKYRPGHPVSESKFALLENFFKSFFSEWEYLRGHRLDVSIKEKILIRMAGFLFHQGSYFVPLPEFQQQLRAVWEDIQSRYPSLHHERYPYEPLLEEGLVAQRAGEAGFAESLYRDFFLLKGMYQTAARTWWEKKELAQICHDLGFEREARELYKNAAFDPQSSASCRIAAALYCKARGEPETAAKLFQLEQARGNPAGYQAYALMLKEQRHFEEAETQFQKGIEADPTHAYLYQAYALMLKEQGRFEEAETQFQKGIEADPTHAALYNAYALMLKEQGRFEEAETQFQKGIEADPTHAYLYNAYALMLKEQGRFEEAETQFQKGIEADPTHAALYNAYALMLKEQGRFEEAETQFQKGIEVDPTDAYLYQAYALMLKEQGRFEEARLLLEETIRLQPNIGLHRFHWLNVVFYGLDAVEEAAEEAEYLLERGNLATKERSRVKLTARLIAWRRAMLDDNAEAQKNTQRHYQYAGRLIDHFNFKRGVEELRKLLEREPTHTGAHYRLAYTLTAHNEIEEGLRHAKLSVLLDPEQPRCRFQLAHSAILAGGQFDLAHDQLDWLLERFPTIVDYLCTRGFAFRQAGLWDEAKATYQAAIDVVETSGGRARTLKNLAQAMMQQEDPEQWEIAWKLLERAWALQPSDPAIFGTRKQLAEKLGRSARIDNPYQLMPERLEPSDPITVQVYQIDKTSGVHVYCCGVPGRLPWIEESDNLQIGEQIENVLLQSVDDKGNLQLSWPQDIEEERRKKAEARALRLDKIQQIGLEPGQYIDAVASDLRSYGVFVDYQGIPGLIHRSTMPNPEAFDPKTFPIQKGESVRCLVLRIQSDGKLELAWEAQ